MTALGLAPSHCPRPLMANSRSKSKARKSLSACMRAASLKVASRSSSVAMRDTVTGQPSRPGRGLWGYCASPWVGVKGRWGFNPIVSPGAFSKQGG